MEKFTKSEGMESLDADEVDQIAGGSGETFDDGLDSYNVVDAGDDKGIVYNSAYPAGAYFNSIAPDGGAK